MGCVGGYQGQAHTYPVGLAKEGLSFSFLDSRRPCSLVLKAAGDGPSCNVTSSRVQRGLAIILVDCSGSPLRQTVSGPPQNSEQIVR